MKYLLPLVFSTIASAADWPQWRGVNHDGISKESVITTGTPKILWKAQIGIGFSSFVVADGRVFTMGHADDQDTVFCFDATTGKSMWKHSYPADLGDKYFEGGTTGTPTVDGARVFTLSRWGDVFCFEAATGRIVWSRNIQKDHDIRIPDWGFTGAPLVSGGILLLNASESGIALDKATGKTLWNSPNKDAGYSTPVPFESGGQKLALLGSGRTYTAVEITTGKVAWAHDWRTSYGVNAADAIVHDGHAFISSGYGKGAALLNLATNPPSVVWETKVMRNQMSPSIRIGDHLYGIDGNEGKNAALKCIEWKTGVEKWSYPESGCGSVCVAGDKLVVLSEKGELSIGTASPAGYNPTLRAPVLSGRCWTVPTLSNGRLYCRNSAGDMVCVGVGGK